MRFFLYLSYKGTAYSGWQVQPDAPSVQGTLQNALSSLTGERTEVTGAGRTDAGVHAFRYVAHFDTGSEKVADGEDFCYHLNCMLPKDIAVSGIRRVHDGAHARFDALSREYKYFITKEKDPFSVDTAWFYPVSLDVGEMDRAAAMLKEYDDFTSFSKLHSDNKTNICRIDSAMWAREGNRLVFTISADRFLRNMVRALLGTLVDVGRGKITADDFRRVIEAKARGEAGSSAPAHGLFLTDVRYGDSIMNFKG